MLHLNYSHMRLNMGWRGKSVIFFLIMRSLLFFYSPLGEDLVLYKFYAKKIVNDGELNFYLYNDVEYPPLAISFISLPERFAKWSGNKVSYDGFFHVLMFAFDFGSFLLVLSILNHLTKNKSELDLGSFWYTLVFFLLPDLIYSRLDMVLSFLLLSVFWLAIVKKWIFLSLGALAVAISFKLIPVVLIPFFCLLTMNSEVLAGKIGRKTILKFVASFLLRMGTVLGVTALLFIPYFLEIGSLSWRFLSNHISRGLHIESIVGGYYFAKSFFGFPVALHHELGSYNLILSSTSQNFNLILLITLLIMLAASFLAIFWKSKKIALQSRVIGPFIVNHPVEVLRFVLFVLVVSIISSKVFSPQYVIWLVPLTVLSQLYTKVRSKYLILGIFVFFIIASTVLWPYGYQSLLKLRNFGKIVLLMRNASLLLFFVLLTQQIFFSKLRHSAVD